MDKKIEYATWEICCDGWYPYCTNCHYEPDRSEIGTNGELPYECPSCKAQMFNWNEFVKTINIQK